MKATGLSTPKTIMATALKQGAKMVDVKFVDTSGAWQHFSVPISELTEDVFGDGFGFDFGDGGESATAATSGAASHQGERVRIPERQEAVARG